MEAVIIKSIPAQYPPDIVYSGPVHLSNQLIYLLK